MDSHSTSVRPALLARSTSPGSAVKHLAVKGQIVGKMRSFPKPGEVTLDSFSSGGVASGELAGNQSVEPTQVRVHRDDSLALIVDPVG